MLLWATAAGGVLLLALSQVQSLWQFWAVWVLIGLVNACVPVRSLFRDHHGYRR